MLTHNKLEIKSEIARYQILNHTGIDTTSTFTFNDEIESEADGILDFTERNPFGNF